MVMKNMKALHAWFFLSSLGGFIIILFGDRFLPEAAMLLPTAVVAFYGLVIGAALSGCDDHAYAEHQIDSVYFMGFLFTLASLITLFYRLQQGGIGGGDDVVYRTFLYAGISVTTSLAGVLGRNMVRSRYLREHPESNDAMYRTYQVLKAMAEQFNTGYRETLEAVKIFLAERAETASSMAEQERRYVKTLETLTQGLEGFSCGLSAAGRELSRSASLLNGGLEDYSRGVGNLSRLCTDMADASERLKKEVENAPLSTVTEELHRFGNGTRELNLVLDSLIDVLETKVERVR